MAQSKAEKNEKRRLARRLKQRLANSDWPAHSLGGFKWRGVDVYVQRHLQDRVAISISGPEVGVIISIEGGRVMATPTVMCMDGGMTTFARKDLHAVIDVEKYRHRVMPGSNPQPE